MLSDSQKAVFTMVADNKAMFECLKEYLLDNFSVKNVHTRMANEELAEVVRAKLDGAETIYSAFEEIRACRTITNKSEGINQAR